MELPEHFQFVMAWMLKGLLDLGLTYSLEFFRECIDR
jgi:hypothetical protein